MTGGLGPSQISGSLSSNGQVFLVNPDGILFGPGAKINMGSFLATTNNISNSDFMAGRYNFSIPGNPAASIVNLGSITAQTGGFAGLVAPGVRNAGIITAKLGTIALASGNVFTLDLYGDNLITLGVNDSIAATVRDVATGRPLRSLVSNSGTLKANGGTVVLTAAAARKVVDSVINNSGVIEANTIGTHNGRIVLGAATGSSKPSGAPKQTVKVAGKLSAAGKEPGTTGGTIEVTGENIVLAGANINASGEAGGGTVLIGGDTGGGKPSALAASIPGAALEAFAVPTATTVSVDAKSVINASATGQGNGGKVVVWSNQDTAVAGTISATGGARGGNGGFVETSGHALDFAGAHVDTSAPNGKTGTWLLDPTDLIIDATAASAIDSALATTNVTLQTYASGAPSGPAGTTGNTTSGAGDIVVASNISWANANTLTLSAFGGIDFQSGALILNTGAGNLILRADNTGTGTGTVSFASSNQIDFSGSTGTVSIFYNPTVNPAGSVVNTTSYKNPTEDFTSDVRTNALVANQLTAYMLVNTVYDLQNIQNNLSGTYALGTNIDASATTTWNAGAGFVPIGTSSAPFTGTFNGQGDTISNLAINLPSSNGVGLFGYVGSNGTVSNFSVPANPITADNWSDTGIPVTAGEQITITASGLVVYVSGGIDQTPTGTPAVNTTGTGYTASGLPAYSLVGKIGSGTPFEVGAGTTFTAPASGELFLTVNDNFYGDNTGSLSARISAGTTGTVTNVGLIGGSVIGQSYVGELVGYNSGAVSQSYATGAVSGQTNVGGLVGSNSSSVSQSYATGPVSAQTNVGGVVGNNNALVSQSYATGTVNGTASVGGLVGLNGGAVTSASATGAVSGNSAVGGLVGDNQGIVAQSYATGPVQGTGSYSSGGDDVGGLVGFSDTSGIVALSYATGNVSGPLDLGGLVGDSRGTVTQSFATGMVTGTNNTSCCGVGGLVGYLSGGSITQSYATGPVSAPQYVGGLVGWAGSATIDQTYSTGAVSGTSHFGGLIGYDNSGNTITSSYVLTTAPAGLPAGFALNAWAIIAGFNSGYPCLLSLAASCAVTPTPTPTPPPTPTLPPVIPVIPVVPPPQPQIVNNPVVTTTPTISGPVVNIPPLAAPPPVAIPQPVTETRVFEVPPPTETRFATDEVLVQVSCDTPQRAIDAVARDMHLSIVASKCMEQSHKTVLRMHIDNGHSVADVIRALERFQVVAVAQPNYTYQAQPEPQHADQAGQVQIGNAVQYALAKLDLTAIHQVVTGSGVKIAIVDSAIDVKNPELAGDIAGEYNAIGVVEPPDTHGTEMAGVIAAHDRLTGIAPGAQIYAVHAFSRDGDTANSSTFSIVNGLDWSVAQGVRVINMSFTGPRDPSIDRALQAAHDKGIVLIAAAGNFGPDSPPLYPGADPNVIAVTATDSNDMVFPGANHGSYISVAAPGVDIAVPAPDATYQLTTGTSIAAAEVSGIVALLLQRNPALTPDDVRTILTSTARHPGTEERNDTYGWGLIDLAKAIEAAAAVKPAATQ